MIPTEVQPHADRAARAHSVPDQPTNEPADHPGDAPSGVFGRDTDHEQVVFCQDRATGLKAIIAIHSTKLGPALGGTRFYPYGSEDAAVADVLKLSRGMTYKAAVAGLDLGGGKAVIIGDPHLTKSEPLLRAYGRFVQALGGRYLTAADVGTFVADMDIIGRECEFVTGRSVEHGGAGDSSVLTAYGVFHGMRAAAEQAWGVDSLQGRRVGVAGVGKVGYHLVRHLLEDGADVVATDVNVAALARLRSEHPVVEFVADTAELVRSDLDVYAPCALGGALDAETVGVLRARVVCGAANNQLAEPEMAELLEQRGVLYAPDYVVNAGGLIQVADEIGGFDFARAERRAADIFETTRRVFAAASAEGVPPSVAADRLAERRIRDADEPPGRWPALRGRAVSDSSAANRVEQVP